MGLGDVVLTVLAAESLSFLVATALAAREGRVGGPLRLRPAVGGGTTSSIASRSGATEGKGRALD